MNHFTLQLQGLFPILSITDISLSVFENTHAKMQVSGVIQNPSLDLLQESYNRRVVSLIDTETDDMIFCGIVDSSKIKFENSFATFKVVAISGSYLLDIEKNLVHFRM